MAQPWFDPNLYAWIPGTLLGILGGGIWGTLAGIFSVRGRRQSLVMSSLFALIATCFTLFLIGIAAKVTGQPYGIWYGIGFPGMLGVIVFSTMIPVMQKRYREAAAPDA